MQRRYRVPVLDEDEYPRLPGAASTWFDHYFLDYFAADESVAGYVALTVCPLLGQSWYWTALVRPDRKTVYVVDNELPIASGKTLELRGSGIWQDMVVETPFDHVSVGLEAFGVGLEEPAEAYGNMFGDRTALGYELDWDTVGEPVPLEGGYRVPCRVHGEILVGQESHELDGWGHRSHRWGEQPPWVGLEPQFFGRRSTGEFFAGPLGSTPSTGLSYAPVAVPERGGGHRLALGFGALTPGVGWLMQLDLSNEAGGSLLL